MKSHPLNFLIKRTHQLWPRMSLSGMCYEGILNLEILRRNFIGSPSRKNTESVSPLHWGICCQDLLSGCFRIRPMWCLFIIPPFMTRMSHWTFIYLYKLITSLLWNFSEMADGAWWDESDMRWDWSQLTFDVARHRTLTTPPILLRLFLSAPSSIKN